MTHPENEMPCKCEMRMAMEIRTWRGGFVRLYRKRSELYFIDEQGNKIGIDENVLFDRVVMPDDLCGIFGIKSFRITNAAARFVVLGK